jgi:hypothetical protein
VDISGQDDFRMAFTFDPESSSPEQALSCLSEFAPEFEWRLEVGQPEDQLGIPGHGEVRIRWNEVHPGDADLSSRFQWEVLARPSLDDDAMHEIAVVFPEVLSYAYVGPWNPDSPDGIETLDAREPHRSLRDFATGFVDDEESLALSVLYDDLDPLGLTARRSTQELTVLKNAAPDFVPLEYGITFHNREGDVVRHDFFVSVDLISADEWRRSLRGLLADCAIDKSDSANAVT